MPAAIPIAAAVAGSVVSGAIQRRNQKKAQEAYNNSQDGAGVAGTGADDQALASAEATRQQTQIAGELWNRYKQVYVPMQDGVIADAKTIDSAENQEAAAGRAHADVSSAMQRQRLAAVERLRSLGVNPSSEKFMDANMKFAAQEAALDAGAQNQAREGVKTMGRNMRASLASGGSGMAQTAGNMFGSAAGASRGLATDAFNRTSSQQREMGQFLSPIVGGVSKWVGDNAGGWMNSAKQGVARWNDPYKGSTDWVDDSVAYNPGASGGGGEMMAQSDYSGGYYADGGVVRGPRGYANGGEVDGPGTGTSDSIAVAVKGPGGVARGYLSDGEFVVPADVVKAKGTEFFNKLIETYHTPVRGVRRKQ